MASSLYHELKGNPGASNTIVFLNGLTQSTLSWGLLVPYFEKDFRILLVDQWFQGQSPKTGEWRNFDEHAADIVQLLDDLKMDKVIVAGLSYGSLVGQHLAVNFPSRVEKLILLSTFARKTGYYQAVELAWHRALDTGGYPLMLDIMLPLVLSDTYFDAPLIPLETMKSARLDLNTDASAIKKLMEATRQRTDYLEKLRKVNIPSLVIMGEKDLLFPPFMGKEVADAIAGCRFEVIPGAGHTLNLEGTAKAASLMLEFIKESNQ